VPDTTARDFMAAARRLVHHQPVPGPCGFPDSGQPLGASVLRVLGENIRRIKDEATADRDPRQLIRSSAIVIEGVFKYGDGEPHVPLLRAVLLGIASDALIWLDSLTLEPGPGVGAALSMWHFSGPPWVIAASAEAATEAICADMKCADEREEGDGLICGHDDPVRSNDDEPFTMFYEDVADIPNGLTRDSDVPCAGCGDRHERDDDEGCVTVTMTAREWCDLLGAGEVIREFQS